MSIALDTEQVIQQCRSGDTKAQRALVQRFAQQMFLHCYRYLKDRSDAEEVLSDGFVKVFQHLARFEYRDEPSFEGWIRRIMVNEALGFLRKRKKVVYVEEREYESIADPLSIEGTIAAEDLYRLVLSLPLQYRTVFNMYAIEGYSHQEIGELLNVTEGSSRSLLSRARKMLHQLIINTENRYDA